MSAEVISIGAELVCGANLDTNSQWLSRELESLGWTVTRHTSLTDDLAQIAAEFRAAATRSQVVIVSGGLGPTLDDLTREALAVAFDQPLMTDEESLQQIRNLFAARGREMPERNQIQAQRPASAVALPNSCGTAPGILMRVPAPVRSTAVADQMPVATGGCLIAVLPGVPAEMKPMFENQVRPHLTNSSVFIERCVIRTFGYGESDAERMLGDLTARGRNPEVGITASEAVISLWITARSSTAAESRKLCQQVRQQIRERLGSAVYGEGDSRLQDAIACQLQSTGRRVALLEGSSTGGLIAFWLTETRKMAEVLASAEVVGSAARSIAVNGQPDADLRQKAESILADGRANFVILSSAHEETTSDQGVPMKKGSVTVIGPEPERTESHDVSISGNLAIFRQRAARTALNRLRLILESESPRERDSESRGH